MATTVPAPAGAVFDFQGKRYLLPPITQDDKREAHAIANAQAILNVREAAKHLPADVAAEEVESARRLVYAGHYWWDEQGGWSWRGTKEGLVQLCWLALRRGNPPQRIGEEGVAVELVRSMAEADGGVWLAEQYRLANADPTQARPAAGQLGADSTPGLPNSGG